MRQIIGVLAVLLILSFVAWDNAAALSNPLDYSAPYIDDTKEDHPWGGEEESPDNGPSLSMPGVSDGGISFVRSNVDLLWNFFIIIWIDNNIKEDPINTEISVPVIEETNNRITNNN
ncbi:MAG: hypothetical protein ABIJ12_01755 [bacterium]